MHAVEVAHRIGMRPWPALDHTLSPSTGWTREHWTWTADLMLSSAERYRSPRGGLITVPGRASRQGFRSDGIEGFARTFLLAAFRHAGDRDRDSSDRLDNFVSGALAATDRPAPGGWDSWPAMENAQGRYGQLQVEAACIALSLHLTRAHTWDRLDEGEKDQLERWLRPALHRTPYPNNWHLFSLTVASFLDAVGRGDERTKAVIARGLDLLDQWYRGDGWYSDGSTAAFDHYNGWALHYYPLLHAHLRHDPAMGAHVGARLTEFLETFVRTFDRNGAPLFMGRSMTYRWAALAAVEVGQVTGHTSLQPGQSRRLMSSTLRYFLERGALQDGIPTLGWHGPHDASVQRYSGAGSPYWASKGFTALMLGEDHPLWTEEEQALGAGSTSLTAPLRGPGFLLQVTGADGLVRLHNHGSDHLQLHEPDAGTSDPHYARLAYSTRTGPTAHGNVSDNDISVQWDGIWSARRRIHAVDAGRDWVASWHSLMFPATGADGDLSTTGTELIPSGRVQCVTFAREHVEVRAFRLLRVPAGAVVRTSGWAVAGACIDDLTTDAAPGRATVERTDGSLSSTLLAALGPWDSASVSPAPAGTAFGDWAAVPELHGRHDGSVLACVAVLTAAGDPEERLPRLQVEGSVVTVHWVDTTASSADFDAPAWASA